MAFTWGKVIDCIEVDLDGAKFACIKYHPWKVDAHGTVRRGEYDELEVLYHVEECRESFLSVDTALIAWIARKNLGLNQGPLVMGVARALNAPEYQPTENREAHR